MHLKTTHISIGGMNTDQLTELLNDEKVAEIVASDDENQLAKVIGRQFFEFTDADERYIDLFWEAAFNGSWLYVSEFMVHEEFGYTKTISMMRDFSRKLYDAYKEGVDFKEVPRNHPVVMAAWKSIPSKKDARGGHNKKYFIITGTTYKKLLQTAHTKPGDIARDYFIKVESICAAVNRLTNMHLKREQVRKNEALAVASKENAHLKKENAEKDKAIAAAEKKTLALETVVSNVQPLDKEQIFYIATTRNYVKQNRFKFGGVKSFGDLKPRLHSYNTGRAEGDVMFFVAAYRCNSYKTVEDRLKTIFQYFKDKANGRKEMLFICFSRLRKFAEFIIENNEKEVDLFNAELQDILHDTLYKEAEEIPVFDIDTLRPRCDVQVDADAKADAKAAPEEKMQIVVSKQGKKQEHLIDISEWTDARVHETLQGIINLCAKEQKKMDYDFTKDKDSLALELTWNLLRPYLQLYRELDLREWRRRLKDWYHKENPRQLVVKGVRF
jgi:hypothetical protein